MSMLTKKNLLFISGTLSAILLIVDILGTDRLCGGNQYTACMQDLHLYFLLLLPVFPLFILTIMMFFVRFETYEPWFRFARLWIPLSMLAIFFAPEYSNFMNPIEKGSVALITSALFILISLVIIGLKYFSLKKGR